MDLLIEVGPTLWAGALTTLAISGAAIAVALVVGLLLAIARLARFAGLRWAAMVYVELIRGSPLLIQLFVIYFGLAQYGIRLDAFTAGMLGLGLNYGAYLSEVFRGSIVAIDRGQREAAESIGLSRWSILADVLLPQAMRIAAPQIGNYFISMLKDSALVSTISVIELVRAAQIQISINFRAMEIYLLVAAIYVVMSFPLSILVRRTELRLSRGH